MLIKMMGFLLFAMEVIDVGNNTLLKVAMAKGMSNYVFTTYTHGIAALFLIPSAFLVHRKTPPPPMGFSILFRLFLLGAIGVACSNLLFIGVNYSSPTLSSAMTNLAPAITFIMGIIFRMENLNIRERSSLLKLWGTLISITGAFIVTFYQGLAIRIFHSSSTQESLSHPLLQTDQANWALGGLFLFASCIFLSLMYVVKTWTARDYNSEVLITLVTFVFETILAALVTLVAEKDTSVWRPSYDIIWISILFGSLEVGIINVVQTWACGKKGPLFVAMFKPLQMIIAAIMGVSFLGDVLHLGSVIGGTIIAIGFYTVMKGKAEEEMMKEDDESTLVECSSQEDIVDKHQEKAPFITQQKLV